MRAGSGAGSHQGVQDKRVAGAGGLHGAGCAEGLPRPQGARRAAQRRWQAHGRAAWLGGVPRSSPLEGPQTRCNPRVQLPLLSVDPQPARGRAAWLGGAPRSSPLELDGHQTPCDPRMS